MLLVAHVSDTHFDGGDRAERRAVAVVGYLNSLIRTPDVVVVTGDVADHGLDAEYIQARSVFDQLRAPVVFLPGNHDQRGPFRSFLAGDAEQHAASTAVDPEPPINQMIELSSARLALCDSTIPGRDDGYLSDATLTWLTEIVASTTPETALFVCFHHPPVDLHSGLLDPIRQHGEDRLAEVLSHRRDRTFILCGHAHTPAATTFAGVPVIVAPAVASTLVLPWEPPPDTLDYDRAPALALHMLDDSGRLTTHYRTLS